MQKKIKIVCFFFLLVLIVSILFNINKKEFIDNIIIFNLYKNSNNEKNKIKVLVKPQTEQSYSVNLYNTIKAYSKVNEKIAPGLNGEFKIYLNSNSDVAYKITFDSKTNKPQNLKFNIKNEFQKYSTLEEMSKILVGQLKRNNTKEISIEWSWEYDVGNEENIQDTLDGKSIDKYYFDITIYGYEI